jgi:hypothetical protein
VTGEAVESAEEQKKLNASVDATSEEQIPFGE